MEVERKWLVGQPLPAEARDQPAEPIDQGYLAVEPGGGEVRLRRRAGRCWLTFKSGSGLVRREHEIELTAAQFDALWPGTEGRRLEKTRRVLGGPEGLTIELDEYRGRLTGLLVAEVEFPDPECAGEFEPPSWFGAEVTGDTGFSNQGLATHGLPDSPNHRGNYG